MKNDQPTLEEQLIRLPHRERARIALKLIESLEPGKDEDVDALWLDESERRLAAYDAGETDAFDANEVFAEIERELK
jgi:putative addiction module component (TIGR02574 family)